MPARKLRIFFLLILFLMIFMMVDIPAAIFKLTQKDLLQYWSAAKIFVLNDNPYNQQLLFSIEKTAEAKGLELKSPIIMYNPPLILSLIWPLAFFSFVQAKIIWLIASLLAVIASGFKLTQFFSLKIDLQKIKGVLLALLILTFPPFYSVLYFGQVSWFFLVGITGFIVLFFGDSKKYFLAGIFLSLTLIKPHLLYLFYLALICFIKREKYQQALQGLLLGGLALGVLPLIYNYNILLWYFEFSLDPPIFWKTPTVGSWLQALTGIDSIGLRLAPALISGLLLLLLFLKKLNFERMLFSELSFFLYLIPISLLTSPYGWVFDMILLLPVVVLILVSNTGSKSYILASAILSAHVLFLLIGSRLGMHYYIWYPALLLLLLEIKRRRKELAEVF